MHDGEINSAIQVPDKIKEEKQQAKADKGKNLVIIHHYKG